MVPDVSYNQIEKIFKDYKPGSQYSKGVLQKVLLVFKTQDDKHIWLITEGERIKDGLKHDFEFYGYRLKSDDTVERTAVRLSVLSKGDIYFGSTVEAIIPEDDDLQLVSDYM